MNVCKEFRALQHPTTAQPNQAPHVLKPHGRTTSGSPSYLGRLPARPLHHRAHHLHVAGHLLGGDGGMHQKHQAGFTKQAGYG